MNFLKAWLNKIWPQKPSPGFEEIMLPRVGVQFWPVSMLEKVGRKNALFREDLEGMLTALTLSFPGTINVMPPKVASHWRKSKAELFELGLRNVRENHIPPMEVVVVEEGVTITQMESPDPYTATFALFLDSLPYCIGKYGAIVSVPTCNAVFCHAFHNMHVLKAINYMVALTAQVYTQGVLPLTTNLYWYHEGKFSTIRYDLESQSLYLPKDFTERLEIVLKENQ